MKKLMARSEKGGGRRDWVLSPCDGDRTVERGGVYDRWSVSVKYDRWGKLGVCVYGEKRGVYTFFFWEGV